MNKEKPKKPIWLIMTGFSCNSNCIMCSVRPKAKSYSDRSTQEIINDLAKGQKQGYTEVEFTGGEPTIRPDIFVLIKTAKKLGYKKIAVSTNGRMLSYNKFCKKIIESGVSSVTFTINAHNRKLGDAISRTPDSFEQTVRGVKNTIKNHADVSVNTVVFEMNYKYLNQIGKYINDLGVNVWHLLDLIPDGYANEFYKILSVSPSNLSKQFNNLKIINKFELVIFFDFPLCLFSLKMLEDLRTHFITAQGRTQITKQTGYDPKRFSKSKKSYKDIHKQRINICKKCRFNKECGGIWKESLDVYGKEEIESLAKKHKFIK
jgi:cyclic pyranopterin phosphate synthase